jgi:hypothetical protein
MYAVVRRFEGVRDSQKVVQVAKEGFCPSSARCRDSWLTTWSTPGTA